MEKYNLDKLVKVVVNDFKPSSWYSYRNEKKFLGIRTQKEGIYGMLEMYYGLKAPENHVLKGSTIYVKPMVCLHFQGGYNKAYFFETYDEAKKYAFEITNDRKWIS